MVICNPISGSGKGQSRLAAVRRALDKAGVRYNFDVTKGRGDGVRLARSAVHAGCSAVVAIGGDGTLFEVVNGVMNPAEFGTSTSQSGDDQIAVGLVQAGRGSDFGRSIGVPSDVDAACVRLLDGRTRQIDLGYVTFRGFDGNERSRYFANAAG